MLRKYVLIGCNVLICCVFLLNIQGCIKEYSYEGAPIDTASEPGTTDTVASIPIYSQCSLCEKNPDYKSGKWSFSIDTFNFCGTITNAVMLKERTAFTFFGPSACSADTGLVFTCSLNKPFDTLASNIIVDQVTLRYYNRAGTMDMFDADGTLGFFLIIKSYSKATGIMKGIFSGDVDTDRHNHAHFANGKFEIQF